MVKYLSGYKGCYQIFVVSRNVEITKQLLEQNIKVGVINDKGIIFLPEEYYVEFTSKEKEEFEEFSERDVLDISENGIVYRWYSVNEGDAGVATTPKCNSNCIMCPASDFERQKNPINIDILKTVINYMPEDLWYFTITGGEPTLVGNNAFLDIYRTVKSHLPFTKILLLTNGRTLGDKAFFDSFITENTERLRVAIPIHGSTPEKHDYITQSPGGFIQTLRGIKNIVNAGIELEIRIVVSKLNCDDLLNISRLIVNYFPGVRIVHFVGLEMRGNCAINADQVIISYEDAFNKSRNAINYLMGRGIDVALYNFPYCMIDKQYWPLARKSISAYKSEFYNECDVCKMRNVCCGIFTATKAFYKPKVKPIKKDDI